MEHSRQARPHSGLGFQVPQPFAWFPLCSAAVKAKCTRAGGGGLVWATVVEGGGGVWTTVVERGGGHLGDGGEGGVGGHELVW
jgi:hypothetical protein